ncbi:succinate dehydrogenase flavoprotein subunit [bacterium]|nr:MAG: succinate dehydrogenase flavoprotein subunit [bacterium]RIK59719.1 MAG: succinate dehydrogenase flavoprotein subunit [Planctomycetota bacterium]
MANKSNLPIIVVGGGLAGLMAALKIAEQGQKVRLFSLVPVKRSHSVCAQGGINGAVNTMGENDHPDLHVYDTLKGGEFLNDQVLVREMCYHAPGIIYLLDRMGVPFTRTYEGLIAFRRFGGTLHHRTAHAGASTGQQLLYALDEQVRRYEAEGLVEKFEFWDMIGLVKDSEGHARGIIAQDMQSMEMKKFLSDAVIMATGGCGLVFGKSTNSQVVTGSANSVCYQAGAIYANGEFIQVHPTAIPGEDKLRLMSESVRGEGGRVWVPKKPGDPRDPLTMPDSDKWFFLEEKYPKYGNLVPRDVATREIFDVCLKGFGVGGGDNMAVYLDLTYLVKEKGKEFVRKKLGAVLDIYSKFGGGDPLDVPMRIFPGMHYTMGGLWADFDSTADRRLNWDSGKNHMTNIPGLYAAGECEFQYHGANRLGANALLSCLFSGMVAGKAAHIYTGNLPKSAEAMDASLGDAELKQCQAFQEQVTRQDGNENVYRLHQELGLLMTKNVTVIRNNKDLESTLGALSDMQQRFGRVKLVDKGLAGNHELTFARWMYNMIVLAKAITRGALLRDEFRGAHYKPAFEYTAVTRKEVPKFKTTTWTDDGDYGPYYMARTGLNLRGGAQLTPEQVAANKAKADKLSPEVIEHFKWFDEVNEKWNKPTLARCVNTEPEITYGQVKMGVMAPVPRKYD